jgi:hypothetical protein
MHAALRPYATAGVALVGASVIAVSPVAPPVPDIQEATTRAVSSAQVELAALANPIEEWSKVFQTAFANATELGSQIAANPAPILEAIGNSQLVSAEFLAAFGQAYVSALLPQLGMIPASIQSALEQIQQGNIQQGVGDLSLAFVTPFIAPLLIGGLLLKLPEVAAVLSNPFDNISNVITTGLSIGTLFNLLPVVLDTLAPVLQIGVTGQEIYDGIQADDYEAAVNAVISFPSEMANTILNGASSSYIGNGGLLGSTGIAQAVLNLRAILASAITPPPVTPPVLPPAAAFAPNAASDTGIEGGQLLSLSAGSQSQVQQQDPPTSGPQTTTIKDADKLTNSGATLVSQTAGTSTATTSGAKASKPGERLRTAFEGTVDRIEKGFDDAVKGFDNALKGLSGSKKADKSGAESAGANAGAGAGAGASTGD